MAQALLRDYLLDTRYPYLLVFLHGIKLLNVLLDVLGDLRMEDVPQRLVVCHVLRVLLFLRHKVTYGRYEFDSTGKAVSR